MIPIARLIRLPNLLIIILTQYLLQYGILLSNILPFGEQPVLPNFQFCLLILSTVLIAAGGYVVNDIEDLAIDAFNKPEHKRIVGRIYPLSIAWKIYWFLTLFGFGISVYLAVYIHDFVQLLIYPAAVFMLYAYSKWWKRQPLIGNIVVAFFCAFVAWVVYYAQSLSPYDCMELYQSTTSPDMIWKGCEKAHSKIRFIFIGYAVFAFMSTLFREIIKDIEDAEGDRLGDCHTLPILIGLKSSKIVAFGVGLVFLILIVITSFILRGGQNGGFKILILNLSVSLPMIYALYKLAIAKDKQDFSFLSKLAKGIMLSGLFFILIMKF